MKNIYGRSSHKSSVSKVINRSGTASELPQLKTPYTPRNGHNKSTYLTQISKQLGDNVEYDEQSSKYITKQQKKLKSILKRMHDDTAQILSNCTPRSNKYSKNINNRSNTTSLLALKQKQSENNSQLLDRYQQQIHILIQRIEKLETKDKAYYDTQINQISAEIAENRENNYLLKIQNQKRGKSIVTSEKILEQGLFHKLQTDKYMLEHRVQKLRAQDERIKQQIKDHQTKIKTIQNKYIAAQKYMKEHQQKNRQSFKKLAIQKQLATKKTKLENYRKKNQFYVVNSQYRYYRVLQKLDTLNSNLKDYNQLQENLDVKISASKQYLERMENKYRQIIRRRKQKQRQVNQFLQQSHLNQRSRTARLSEFEDENQQNNQIQKQSPLRDNREDKVIDIQKNQSSRPNQDCKDENNISQSIKLDQQKQLQESNQNQQKQQNNCINQI